MTKNMAYTCTMNVFHAEVINYQFTFLCTYKLIASGYLRNRLMSSSLAHMALITLLSSESY